MIEAIKFDISKKSSEKFVETILKYKTRLNSSTIFDFILGIAYYMLSEKLRFKYIEIKETLFMYKEIGSNLPGLI